MTPFVTKRRGRRSRHNLTVEEVVGGVFGVIGKVTSTAFGAAARALDDYDGRQVRWPTVFAASLSAALYAPMVVGAGFGLKAAWMVLSDDFLWIAGVFIGGFFVLAALLLFAFAASAVGMGVAIGAWLLVDRPGSRWYAGFYAAGGLISGVFVLAMQTWVTRVIGWSTVGLAVALMVAVLLPQGEVAISEPPPDSPDVPEEKPLPAFTQPVTDRGRFVL